MYCILISREQFLPHCKTSQTFSQLSCYMSGIIQWIIPNSTHKTFIPLLSLISIFYRSIKNNLQFEPYLDSLPKSKRITLSKFRLSNHRFPSETGSWYNIPPDRKYNPDHLHAIPMVLVWKKKPHYIDISHAKYMLIFHLFRSFVPFLFFTPI